MRKFIIIALIFISFKNPLVIIKDTCKECHYKGGISKVKFDRVTGNYLKTYTQLGEAGLTFDIDSCIINKQLIKLKGTVFGRIPKNGKLFTPLANIVIIKAIGGKMEFVPIDTLAITNEDGEFNINTSKIKNGYLIIKMDSVGTVYSLEEFK
jgi:hypothetical protein